MRYASGRRRQSQSQSSETLLPPLRAALAPALTHAKQSKFDCLSSSRRTGRISVCSAASRSALRRSRRRRQLSPKGLLNHRRSIGARSASLAAVCEKRNKLNSPASSAEAEPQGSVTLAVMLVADLCRSGPPLCAPGAPLHWRVAAAAAAAADRAAGATGVGSSAAAAIVATTTTIAFAGQ